MAEKRWIADVRVDNARWPATECRTARLAPQYRPAGLGGGRVVFSARALDAIRELGEEEDGSITDDREGLRTWIGEDASEREDEPAG